MPGISFLNKKKFHPGRMDQQKRVYEKEAEHAAKKQKEDDARKEVEKEIEASYYENLGQLEARDPRNSSLKFMYNVPKSVKDAEDTTTGDGEQVDPYVEAFWAKWKNINNKDDGTTSQNAKLQESSTDQQQNESLGTYISDRCDGFSRPIHPALISAPKASYIKSLSSIKFKPFNDIIRNVQCSLCKEIGHRFGDRECKMRDYNPHDYARMIREDPLTYMDTQFPEDKQFMIMSQAVATVSATKEANKPVQSTVPTGYESDPEAEFLSTLTAREKRLLLRKLRILQGEREEDMSDVSSVSLSSDSGDDSTSSDESTSDRKKSRHKSSKKRKNSKNKHKSKKSHKRHRKEE